LELAPRLDTATAVHKPAPMPATPRSHRVGWYCGKAMHKPLATTTSAAPHTTRMRRLARPSSAAASSAPNASPPRSAPATRPTSTLLKPSSSMRAELITGMATCTP
jgi:hypothetical protein